MGVGGNIECRQIASYETNTVIKSMDALTFFDILIVIIGTENASIIQVNFYSSVLAFFKLWQRWNFEIPS